MSGLAIRVAGVGKSYRLGAGPSSLYIQDHLLSIATAPWRAALRLSRREATPPRERFWALQDISFDVQVGEVVGIIGRNGAGKSTLLKILSRVTSPETGEIDLYGRVGSLLEVGSGFHPELTGRENVYLNGAILGMTRIEVRQKFDDIISFAEVNQFIDTPVKFYSSGMYMRLAFAIAAHLEPEILIVDEVLAVGDAQFQKKCLGKMGEVAKGGRTVIFVSHNLGAVAELCQSAVVLQSGRMVFHGAVREGIDHYLAASQASTSSVRTLECNPAKPIQVLKIEVANTEDVACSNFDLAEAVVLLITYRVNQPGSGYDVVVTLSRNGTHLFTTLDTDHRHELTGVRRVGEYATRFTVLPNVLKAGLYSVTIGTGITNKSLIEIHDDIVRFQVEELGEDTQFKGYADWRAGHIIAPVKWEFGEQRIPQRD